MNTEELQVLCAWCGKRMSGPEISTRKPSHGVCAECAAKVALEDPESPIAPPAPGRTS